MSATRSEHGWRAIRAQTSASCDAAGVGNVCRADQRETALNADGGSSATSGAKDRLRHSMGASGPKRSEGRCSSVPRFHL